MTLAEAKLVIFKDENHPLEFNDQLDIDGNPTGWLQYFYNNRRIMVVMHSEVFEQLSKLVTEGANVDNIRLKHSVETTKEGKNKGESYVKTLISIGEPAKYKLP